MAYPRSPSYYPASTAHPGTFETHLAIPVYACAWVIMWLAGTLIEFAIFIGTSVAKGHALDRKYFEVSLYMPSFALFCLGMWMSVKCVEWLIGFLGSLATDDGEESYNDEPIAVRGQKVWVNY